MMTRDAALKYLYNRTESTLSDALAASPEAVGCGLDNKDRSMIRGKTGRLTPQDGVTAIRGRAL